MEITGVEVRKSETGPVLAFASIFLDNMIAIRDIKVLEGPERLFLSMPSRRVAGGRYQDIAHPLTRPARELVEEAILSAYRKMLSEDRDFLIVRGSDETGA